MAAILDGLKEYHSWAFDTMGIRSEGVIVAELPPPLSRGWISTRAIPAGTRVLSVPVGATLSPHDVKSHPIKPFVDALLAAKVTVVEDDVLALMLVYERDVRGSASKLWPHIRMLPARVDVPYMYSDEEMEAVRGTNLHPIGSAMRRQMASDHDAMTAVLRTMTHAAGKTATGAAARAPMLTPEIFTLDAYCWGLTMVCSRAASLRYTRESKPSKTLVPFFDMANHASSARMRHFYDHASRCVVAVTDEPLPAGAHICLNYGDTTNVNMMRLYGFLTPGHPAQEIYTLQASLREESQLYQERLVLLNKFVGFTSSTPDEIVAATNAAAKASKTVVEGTPAGGEAAETVVSTPSDPRCVQGCMYEVTGGVGLDFGLSYGAAHLGILRALRILRANSLDELNGVADVMRRNPDEGATGIEGEVTLLQQLADALNEQIKQVPPLPDEDALVADYLASQAQIASIVESVTAAVRAELLARKLATPADFVVAATEALAEGGDDEHDEDEESFASASIVMGKKGGPAKKKGSSKKTSKGKKRSHVAAKPAPDATSSAPETAAAAAAPSTRAAAAEIELSEARYRRMLAAYLRHTERRILKFHLKSTVRDIEELRAIAESWNAENAAATEAAPEEAPPAAEAV